MYVDNVLNESTNIEEEEDKQLSIDSESNNTDDESVLKFGEDDLEIPAFLRNGN